MNSCPLSRKFEASPSWDLDAVFQEWMIRFKKCIDGNGENVEWYLTWNVQFFS
jgi:hypothetical protein